ncbi:transcriptional regulator, MarR family [Aliiroseovarius halocynthiae]|uniref:Homoprotocatechuate degradation operon regulator HpaR n=1 Tax=Aliiroseovarius halocynthiae TaxID=985055 RepID=A0A545SR34_9RHOB|nr:homoprotocatechuate degradation operon regulator HpaR [Aliiroseovarius halocynthiae]TQV67422.1 homoprotocatechuate degradation operon regulator HpaR [Aliiroseovarius halocynthiae]SMR81413.1 transcriptional regulator, MarR family [Aliiroseovarius halocynthiae]
MSKTSSTRPSYPSTARSLPISLLRAREVVMQPIRDMLGELGLTEQKWRILRTLDELGEVEQSTIAKEACLLLPSLTRILRGLEADGLISRQSDVKDKRRTLVLITDKGRAIVRDNLHLANDIAARIEAHMGEGEVEQLLDLLEKLQTAKL